VVESRRDLAAVAGYAVLAATAVWVLHPGGAGGLILAPLLVVCPGYALVRAIESHRRPDALELVVTTVALSFATAVLGGLLLNTLNLGLTAHTWSALFLVVTVAAAAVAADRRVEAENPTRRRSIRIGALPLLAAATICALLSAAALIAIRSQQSQDRRTATTALGVVPSDGGSTLRISVVNADAGSRRYRVRIDVGQRTTTSFSIALASGGYWSGTRHVSRPSVGPVRIELFSATRSNLPLRTVILAGLQRKTSTG
jgi:hypothetical protein